MALGMLLIAERLLKKRMPPKDSVKMLEVQELKDVVFDLFVSVLCGLQRMQILTNLDPGLCLLLQWPVVCILLRTYRATAFVNNSD